MTSKEVYSVIAGEDISAAEMHTSELDIDMRGLRLNCASLTSPGLVRS